MTRDLHHKKYEISQMSLTELRYVFEWARSEGWNPCMGDVEAIYAMDSDGFYVCKDQGRIVGSISAVIYDRAYAFIGLLIVDQAYRGGMMLRELLEAVCSRIRSKGIQSAGCDGVLENVRKYERLGFELAYMQARFVYVVHGTETICSECSLVQQADYEEVQSFVRQYEPELRKGMVRRWHEDAGAKGYMVHDGNGEIIGYGAVRKACEGYRVGPLYAVDNVAAKKLLMSLISLVPKNERVQIDVPEVNSDGIEMVKQMGMQKKWQLGRMYYGMWPQVDVNGIFGVWSAEVG
ncbi:GNAT family N-acetyltransferase [Poriferisphaera sp. WC338]|uniref:GNAT family N-acetyltransferase n=1 Tax=Poriferisphaera sp. WC338 TaxID=3425129 RepID=UPI003D817ADD